MKMDDLVPIDYDHEVRAQHPNPVGTPNHHRIPKLRFKVSNHTKEKTKMAKSVEGKKAVEKKEAPKVWGTKEVAKKLGVDPKYLRTVLRASGKKADNGEIARYQWKPDSDLSKLKKLVEDHQEKAAKRAEAKDKPKAKKKAAKKDEAPAKKGKKKAKPAEDEEEETEEVEEGGE